MTHELRNTREAKDEEPERTYPAPGRFMDPRALADALQHHVEPLKQERDWCGDMRALPHLNAVLSSLDIAIALLRTERHR